MEIKRLISKYVYRIEPSPGGGFIARATDPSVPPLEAPTRQELQQKIQSVILAGLGADFPSLKLPSQETGTKFSFHVEKQPDGTFDIHSSDPSSSPVNAASHDLVESHFAEKLISFVGKHLPQDVSESLRAQMAAGNIEVFINKGAGFTVTTSHDTIAGQPQFTSSSDPTVSNAANLSGNDGPIFSNVTPNATFGESGSPIDSSPITPGGSSSGRMFRIVLVLLVLAAIGFFLLKYR